MHNSGDIVAGRDALLVAIVDAAGSVRVTMRLAAEPAGRGDGR
jgi:hypothetical protein